MEKRKLFSCRNQQLVADILTKSHTILNMKEKSGVPTASKWNQRTNVIQEELSDEMIKLPWDVLVLWSKDIAGWWKVLDCWRTLRENIDILIAVFRKILLIRCSGFPSDKGKPPFSLTVKKDEEVDQIILLKIHQKWTSGEERDIKWSKSTARSRTLTRFLKKEKNKQIFSLYTQKIFCLFSFYFILFYFFEAIELIFGNTLSLTLTDFFMTIKKCSYKFCATTNIQLRSFFSTAWKKKKVIRKHFGESKDRN